MPRATAPPPVGTFTRALKGEDRCGWRKEVVFGEELTLAFVADGHAGHAAAELCAERALSYVIAECEADASGAELQKACAVAFERLHKEARAASGSAGCTLTVAIVNEKRQEITIANAGDSAAMLLERDSPRILTAEHRLSDSPEERERVESVGGKVAQWADEKGPRGPLRAWPGGLAVCRCIGDAPCPSVSAVPSTVVTQYDPTCGGVLVLASDGVWDAISPEQVASKVHKGASPCSAAEKIVKFALRKTGPLDDMTAVVIPLSQGASSPSRPRSANILGYRLSISASRESSSESSSDSSSFGRTLPAFFPVGWGGREDDDPES
ncbi:hypothetical protein AB1Y20_017220 [Prymnesium parvum]|uniref:PPM-type phosphatase domain-containing protein n=1 Tax=Prymnesium parvum TaxID=97485 RepID=A0AB34IAV7_PRYPA